MIAHALLVVKIKTERTPENLLVGMWQIKGALHDLCPEMIILGAELTARTRWEQDRRVDTSSCSPWELSGSCRAPEPCELPAGRIHAPRTERYPVLSKLAVPHLQYILV